MVARPARSQILFYLLPLRTARERGWAGAYVAYLASVPLSVEILTHLTALIIGPVKLSLGRFRVKGAKVAKI